MLRIVPTRTHGEVATSVEQEIAEIKDAAAPPTNQEQLRRRHTDGGDIQGETVTLLTDAIIAWSITYIEPATQHLTAAGTHVLTRHARTHQPLRTIRLHQPRRHHPPANSDPYECPETVTFRPNIPETPLSTTTSHRCQETRSGSLLLRSASPGSGRTAPAGLCAAGAVRVDPDAERVVDLLSTTNAHILDATWEFGHSLIPSLDEAIEGHTGDDPLVFNMTLTFTAEVDELNEAIARFMQRLAP